MDDSIGKSKAYLSNLSTLPMSNGASSSSYAGVASGAMIKKNEINYKHLINFNQLAEKLKKIQKANNQFNFNHAATPTPLSSCSPSKSKSKPVANGDTLQATIAKKHLIFPRSVSTFDSNRRSAEQHLLKPKVSKKFSYNSIDRDQVQNNYQLQQQQHEKIYSSNRNLNIEPAPFFPVNQLQQHQPSSTHPIHFIPSQHHFGKQLNKNHRKSELSIHSSLSESSSLSSFVSESFEMSCSASSSRSSSFNSFYGEHRPKPSSHPSLSANATVVATANQPIEPIKASKPNHSHTFHNSNSLRSKYGMSTNNVENFNVTPAKQIVIRRERSIGFMQQSQQEPLVTALNYSNKPLQIASSSFNALYYNSNQSNMNSNSNISTCNTNIINSVGMNNTSMNNTPFLDEPHQPNLKLTRSKPLKTCKSTSSSSNRENGRQKSSRSNNNTSSTTSGVESNSKNSNPYDNEATNKESRSDIGTTDSAASAISSSMEINDLKNRLFIAETDLSNERKKLNQEKDLKKYITFEMKSRYEAEKSAALKALEAKLNAEKIQEINKLKEKYELNKRDQIESKQKNMENQVLNLKVKLREKSEKCSNLEKLLKEEQSKNNQLYSKSIEMVQKYNHEIKILSEKQQHQQQVCSDFSANQVQNSHESSQSSATSSSFDLNSKQADLVVLKKRLFNIHSCLSNQTYSAKAKEELDINVLISQIEALTKNLIQSLNDSAQENRSMRDQIEKFTNDLNASKESQHKIEALYKVKCKSDLNKSAQIKKCQINYDLELMKFRNEFNFDLVKHLENHILIKETELLELNAKLENINSLISNYSVNNNENMPGNSICEKDILKSLFNIINYKTNESHKKVPLNVLFIQEADNVSNKISIKRAESSPIRKKDDYQSIQSNNSNKKGESKQFQLHDEMTKLDRQLSEMKSLKLKLAKEKQELLELNKDCLSNKPNRSFRREQESCIDPFNTSNCNQTDANNNLLTNNITNNSNGIDFY